MQKCTEDKKAGSPLSMTLKSLGLGHGKCSINVLKSRDIPPTGPSLFLEPKLSLLLQFRHVWQCLCAGWKREKSESVSYSVMSSSLWLHEILQARILKWIAIFFSRGSSQPRDQIPGLLTYTQILYHLSHQWDQRAPMGLRGQVVRRAITNDHLQEAD